MGQAALMRLRAARQRVREPWLPGAALLSALAFLSFAWNGDSRADCTLSITTRSTGGSTGDLRIFVDGRFRGLTENDRPSEMSIPSGPRRIELKDAQGSVVAAVQLEAVHPQNAIVLMVPSTASNDPSSLLRQRGEQAFEERCVGEWPTTLIEPGRRQSVRARATVVSMSGADASVCGQIEAGPLGRARLEECSFDGTSTLFASVALGPRQRYLMRLECRAGGTLSLLAPSRQGTLAGRTPAVNAGDGQ